MTDNFADNIDGVGPAREERLIDEGYETFADLAEADPEELAESIQRLPQDSALEIVVQAQNLADLEDASVEENPEPESVEADVSESEATESDFSEDSASPSPEDQTDSEATESDSANSDDEGEPDLVEFELSFDSADEYDTFYNTVYYSRNNMYRTNRPERAGVYDHLLDSLRPASYDENVPITLKPQQLHDLHNDVRSRAVDFQGENLMGQHDALRRIEEKINEVREAELF